MEETKMNNKKKLVTLKDYIDSGVTEKMVLGFSLYDADLENYEGKPLDLTSNFDKFHDCEVVSIIASPNPISPTRFAELIISISTTNFRITNNLNEDDFRNMIISNGDYYTKKMNNSISLSFNNNKIVGEIMNYLFDGGVKSETIKLILFVDNPIPHYVNLYTYLFNNLHSLFVLPFFFPVVTEKNTLREKPNTDARKAFFCKNTIYASHFSFFRRLD